MSECANVNRWCFVCCKWIKSNKHRKSNSHTSRPLSESVIESLYDYFDSSLDGIDFPWAPQVVCMRCYVELNKWRKDGSKGLSVKVPASWSPPEDHQPGDIFSNCFFCRSVPPNGRQKARPFFDGCVQAPVFRTEFDTFPGQQCTPAHGYY